MGIHQTTALYLHRQGVTMLDKRKTIADRSPDSPSAFEKGMSNTRKERLEKAIELLSP